jgi:hypothetical protein
MSSYFYGTMKPHLNLFCWPRREFCPQIAAETDSLNWPQQDDPILDPLSVLRCDRRTFRVAPLLEVVLYILKACLAASRVQLQQHIQENPIMERNQVASSNWYCSDLCKLKAKRQKHRIHRNRWSEFESGQDVRLFWGNIAELLCKLT